MPESNARGLTKIRGQLERAAQDQHLVRVSRAIKGSDDMDGSVIALSDAWVLLAVLAPRIDLDGYAALRIHDIAKVTRRGGEDSFVVRALQARGEWPPQIVDINLEGLPAIIASAAEIAALVTLHLEATDPDVCYIGRPVKLTNKQVHLLDITPSARWRDQPRKWPLTDVTRVEIGGRYEQALALVGGPPPT